MTVDVHQESYQKFSRITIHFRLHDSQLAGDGPHADETFSQTDRGQMIARCLHSHRLTTYENLLLVALLDRMWQVLVNLF